MSLSSISEYSNLKITPFLDAKIVFIPIINFVIYCLYRIISDKLI